MTINILKLLQSSILLLGFISSIAYSSHAIDPDNKIDKIGHAISSSHSDLQKLPMGLQIKILKFIDMETAQNFRATCLHNRHLVDNHPIGEDEEYFTIVIPSLNILEYLIEIKQQNKSRLDLYAFSIPAWSEEKEKLEQQHLALLVLVYPNLKVLKMIEPGHGDYKTLRRLPFLKKLAIYEECFLDEDLPTLASLTHLQSLDFQDCSLPTIDFLRHLTGLEDLNLQGTSIKWRNTFTENDKFTKMKMLANLTNLKRLDLSDTKISDISVLASLTKLECLNLRRTAVSRVSPLAYLTNLEYLNLQQDNINKISKLAPLGHLRYLNLHHTDIKDISVLEYMYSLETLEISDAHCAQVSSTTCPKVHQLIVHGIKSFGSNLVKLPALCEFGLVLPNCDSWKLISFLRLKPLSHFRFTCAVPVEDKVFFWEERQDTLAPKTSHFEGEEEIQNFINTLQACLNINPTYSLTQFIMKKDPRKRYTGYTIY